MEETSHSAGKASHQGGVKGRVDFLWPTGVQSTGVPRHGLDALPTPEAHVPSHLHQSRIKGLARTESASFTDSAEKSTCLSLFSPL